MMSGRRQGGYRNQDPHTRREACRCLQTQCRPALICGHTLPLRWRIVDRIDKGKPVRVIVAALLVALAYIATPRGCQ